MSDRGFALAIIVFGSETVALDAVFPAYGFAVHKGYPTKEHIAAINQHGILPIHRKTFNPVRSLLSDGAL